MPPRQITVPNLDTLDLEVDQAWGYQKPTPWWTGLDQAFLNFVDDETRRLRETIRTDWLMLRFAWTMVRLWLS